MSRRDANAFDHRDVGDFYDRFTEIYAQIWDRNLHLGYWQDGSDQASLHVATVQMTDQLIQRLAPPAGGRILDVGSGLGEPAISLAISNKVDVTGVTVSRRQAEIATARAVEAGLPDRVRFEVADAGNLPFVASSFDGAWFFESMLHMPDKIRALTEVARVLRPGGRLAIADMYELPGSRWSPARRSVAPASGPETYLNLLEGAGMTVLGMDDVSPNVRLPPDVAVEIRARLLAHKDELQPVVSAGTLADLLGPNSDDFDGPAVGYVLIAATRPP